MSDATLTDLASIPRWVAWRNEPQAGRITKVPKDPHTLRDAASTRPETWATRQQAEAAYQRFAPGPGGVGLILGEWSDGYSIGGVDLDSCRDAQTGTLEPWASDVLTLLNTYAEVSPSGTGVKAFFFMAPGSIPSLREAKLLDADGYGRCFKRGTGADHPPAIEVHLGARYYTVTDDCLPNMPAELRHVPADTVGELLGKVGPRFARSDSEQAKPDRSALAFRLARQMVGAGKGFADYLAALDEDPELAKWKQEKGEAQSGGELRRAWDRAGEAPAAKSFRVLTASTAGGITAARDHPVALALIQRASHDLWAAWYRQNPRNPRCCLRHRVRWTISSLVRADSTPRSGDRRRNAGRDPSRAAHADHRDGKGGPARAGILADLVDGSAGWWLRPGQ